MLLSWTLSDGHCVSSSVIAKCWSMDWKGSNDQLRLLRSILQPKENNYNESWFAASAGTWSRPVRATLSEAKKPAWCPCLLVMITAISHTWNVLTQSLDGRCELSSISSENAKCQLLRGKTQHEPSPQPHPSIGSPAVQTVGAPWCF